MKKTLILLFSILISFNSYGETKYYYYSNGQIYKEINYKDDKLDGKSTSWNKNGQKVRQKNYTNGELVKLIEWFQFNGQIKREENYKNGKICLNGC